MNVKDTRGEVLDQLNKLLTRNHDAKKVIRKRPTMPRIQN